MPLLLLYCSSALWPVEVWSLAQLTSSLAKALSPPPPSIESCIEPLSSSTRAKSIGVAQGGLGGGSGGVEGGDGEGGGGDGEGGGGDGEGGGGDGEGGGGLGGVDGGGEGGVEGGIIPMNTFMAPISSCKAAISSEQPQVGDGELNPDAAGVTAVALTPCSTQEATSNWNRRVPLTLKSE